MGSLLPRVPVPGVGTRRTAPGRLTGLVTILLSLPCSAHHGRLDEQPGRRGDRRGVDAGGA
ncbi:hypothetical protein AB0885_30525, partial [Streptomyces sp. NPDC005534]|uniref:hypothetical protein n=1 Tax=Streptomyces sp. NPDC005534 TaxID=3155714 RepID=UPI003451353F